MHDDDDFEDIADLIADHSEDLDVLSHLPTYQHKVCSLLFFGYV